MRTSLKPNLTIQTPARVQASDSRSLELSEELEAQFTSAKASPDRGAGVEPGVSTPGRGASHPHSSPEGAQAAQSGPLAACAPSGLQGEPGWKLILIAPKPAEEILPGEQLQLLSLPEVEEQLGDVRQLLGAGQQEAAILLAWAAVEGQLRELARQEEIPLPRPGTLTLLRQLVSLGLIDREQYRALADAYKARSAVAHGFRPPSELVPAVQALLGLSEAIARESSKSQIRKEEMEAAEEFFQGEVEWPEY